MSVYFDRKLYITEMVELQVEIMSAFNLAGDMKICYRTLLPTHLHSCNTILALFFSLVKKTR